MTNWPGRHPGTRLSDAPRAARMAVLACALLAALAARAQAQGMTVLELRLAGVKVAQVADVGVKPPGAADRAATVLIAGTALAQGTELLLPARVEVVLQSQPAGVLITLSPGSRYKVHSVQAQGQVHELVSGFMQVAVLRQLDFFNVQFDRFFALVKGTEFSLAAADEQAPTATLHSGRLRVESPQRALIGPGVVSEGLAQIDALHSGTAARWAAGTDPASAERRFADAASAEAFYSARLDQARSTGDDDELLAALNDLGRVRVDIGKPAQAAAQFTEGRDKALALRDLPWLARMLNNLGAAELARQRTAQALDLVQQALALNLRLYPDGASLRVAGNYNNLGLALRRLDQPAQAEQAFEQALAVHHRLLRPARKGTRAGVLQNLGNLLVGGSTQAPLCAPVASVAPDREAARARVERGLAHLQEALVLNQAEAEARGDAELARTHINLGVAYLRLCQLPEAETQMRAALALRLQRYSEGLHPLVEAAHRALEETLRRAGRVQEAEEQHARAEDIRRRLQQGR